MKIKVSHYEKILVDEDSYYGLRVRVEGDSVFLKLDNGKELEIWGDGEFRVCKKNGGDEIASGEDILKRLGKGGDPEPATS